MARSFSGVSLVIPTVRNVDESSIVKSFLNVKNFSKRVQFIFLLNHKIPAPPNQSPSIYDGYEIFTIPNDRYFGSCEENIGRASDFSDILSEYICFVGEHDEINWQELELVLDRAVEQDLDVLGWNIDSQQLTSTGIYSRLPALRPLNIDSLANHQCTRLFEDQVMRSSMAFPALISTYGPVDWAAYLGNHLLKKFVFQRLFQYKFSESVYSLVYREFKFFSRSSLRYAFHQKPVISRLSDDFLKMREKRYSPGWLEEHRAVGGLSPCFSLSNLQCMVELDDIPGFNLIANSLCFAQVPSATDESIHYHHGSFLSKSIAWVQQALIHRLRGPSYYLPDLAPSGSFGDVGTGYRFLSVLYSQVRCLHVYDALGKVFLRHLSRAVFELEEYLAGDRATENALSCCLEELKRCGDLLDSAAVVQANQSSFSEFVMHRR